MMFLFGALDLYAFYRLAPKIVRAFENATGNLFSILFLLGAVSLIVSGTFTMIGSRIGYMIYYFQFPLKFLVSSGLTFGFLFYIQVIPGTLYFGMLWATVFALEAIRLMYTIQQHRNLS